MPFLSAIPNTDVTRIGPTVYYSLADPGTALGAGKFWFDGTNLRLRNQANSGYALTVAVADLADVATQAYVDAAIAALVASSPAALDTLNELAAALGDDANFATTITNALALKAPLANPTLTGSVNIPTAAPGTNSTIAASTAFVAAIVASIQAQIDAVVGGTSGTHVEGMDWDSGNTTVTLTAGRKKQYRLTRGGTISKWTLVGDATGSAVVNIRTCTFATFPGSLASIVAAAKPTLSAAQAAESAVLTGWTTALTAGDMIEFELESCSGLASLIIELTVI